MVVDWACQKSLKQGRTAAGFCRLKTCVSDDDRTTWLTLPPCFISSPDMSPTSSHPISKMARPETPPPKWPLRQTRAARPSPYSRSSLLLRSWRRRRQVTNAVRQAVRRKRHRFWSLLTKGHRIATGGPSVHKNGWSAQQGQIGRQHACQSGWRCKTICCANRPYGIFESFWTDLGSSGRPIP